MYVWRSSKHSVESENISIFAIAEVCFAVLIYWSVAIWLHSQFHLWISIVIAPLLLLRSDASVHQGSKWFSQYIDRSFSDVLQIRKGVFFSLQFLGGVIIALLTAFASSYALAGFFLSQEPWIVAIGGVGASYIATQAALAMTVAVAAKEVAAVAQRRLPAAIVAALLIVAICIGAMAQGAASYFILMSAVTTAGIAVGAVVAAPQLVKAAMSGHTNPLGPRLGGIDIARRIVGTALRPFAAFVPGFLIGAWLRSIGIRFAATALHIGPGVKRLGKNYQQTLFVIDVFYPPEIVPGHNREDPFNVSYFWSRRKKYTRTLQRFFLFVGFVILFFPAYLYRLSIKSTAWAYWPVVYLAAPSRFKESPDLFYDLLTNRKELVRQIVASGTLVFLVIINIPLLHETRVTLPTSVISPLEYFFLLSYGEIKPWTWLLAANALLTITLFLESYDLKSFIRHKHATVSYKAHVLEILVRLRNICTWIFLATIFIHALLMANAVQCFLPRYIINLLFVFYGSAMPPTSQC